MSDKLLTPELDYKPAAYRHGSKMYTQIIQQAGGSNATVPVSSTVYSDFELPIRALYLSDSYIRCTATPTAPGAGFYNWFRKDQNFITEISLMTRSGVFLCQLMNADRHRALTRPWHVTMEDFLAADDSHRFNPSRASGHTADIGGRPTATALPAAAPYTEIQYAERSAQNAATPFPLDIRLSDFHDTIFAMNKCMLFPEIVILRVAWGPLNRFSWIGSDPTDPTAGAANPAGPLALSNMSLQLQIENDPDIARDLMAMQASAYQIAIPWVNVLKQNIPASTFLALTTKITPDMGFMVKQLTFGIFRNDETLYRAQDHSNLEGTRLGAYQTSLDSVTRQQQSVSCGGTGGTGGQYDDYKLMYRLCRGTALQNRNVYQYNWFHCEDFSDLSERRLDTLDATRENVYSGLSIQGPQGSDRTWTITSPQGLSNVEAFNMYSVITTYKTMIITPTGVQVVNLPPA